MMSKVNAMRMVVALFLAAVWVCPAGAAFVSGVETFDGTVKDTTTWEEFTDTGTSISQDDTLEISAFDSGTGADYTTKTQTVGVGEKVRYEVVITSANGSGSRVVLGLTNNSGGTSARVDDDEYRISFVWLDRDLVDVQAGNLVQDFNDYRLVHHLNETIFFEIERLTSNTARFSMYDASENAIGSSMTLDFTGVSVPDDLYVFVKAGKTVTEFDNITITPEPGTLSLIGLGGLGLLLRKRR